MHTLFFPTRWLAAASLALLLAAGAQARNANGNDFALYYSEARSDAERKALLDEAGRRPHFFRYLQIMEMEEGVERGRPWVRFTTLEPASLLDVVFTIEQSVGLATLKADPPAQPGDALAVSGVIRQIDPRTGSIHLDPTVLRHKDRLTPAIGMEMLYEVDEGALYYSFTGGREIVKVSYRDRDLLRHRDRIMSEGGDQAWADFLHREVRRREAARKAGERAP